VSDGVNDPVSSDAAVSVTNEPPEATFGDGGGAGEGGSFTLSLSDPSDPSSGDTQAGFEYAFDCGDGSGYSDWGSSDTVDCPAMDDGTYTVGAMIRDQDGAVTEYTSTVTVSDLAPTAAFIWLPEPQDEGSPVQFTDQSSSSPDAIVSWSWSFGGLGMSTLQSPSFTFVDDGVYSVCLTVTDDDGSTDNVCHEVTVQNVPPSVTLIGPTSVDEGDIVSYNYTTSDPGDDTFTLISESCGGAGILSSSAFEPTMGSGSFDCTFPDGPAASDVSVTLNDDNGGSGGDSLTVAVDNVAPTIDSIVVPIDPVNINDQSLFGVDVIFSDPAGANDELYTCDFDLDYDGMTFAGDATVSASYRSCSAPLNYAEPGVYTVKVIVTDKDNESGSGTADGFIVIYDPEGDSVKGRGWIASPEGAYTSDPSYADKAHFGILSDYSPGASAPTGWTDFRFKKQVMDFHSDNFEWLVVNQGGINAQLKGTGTINGDVAPSGEAYKFMLWAKDLSPDADDTLRIKIWYEDDIEVVVYDNGFDQAIDGGQILIGVGN
jgi:PKD repeat protein